MSIHIQVSLCTFSFTLDRFLKVELLVSKVRPFQQWLAGCWFSQPSLPTLNWYTSRDGGTAAAPNRNSIQFRLFLPEWSSVVFLNKHFSACSMSLVDFQSISRVDLFVQLHRCFGGETFLISLLYHARSESPKSIS